MQVISIPTDSWGLTTIMPAMNNAPYSSLLSKPHSANVLAIRITVKTHSVSEVP